MALNPVCAFRACALLAAGKEGAARAMTGELLAALGGSLPGAELYAAARFYREVGAHARLAEAKTLGLA
jgi:hypothetical protein